MKDFLFDDIPGEKFCAESLVLNRIGKITLCYFLMKKYTSQSIYQTVYLFHQSKTE